MTKKIFIFFCTCFFSVFLFTQEIETSDYDDELDDLFAVAEDVVVEEVKEAPTPISTSKPITFTGYLDSDLGAGFAVEPDDWFSPLGYLSFANSIYMSARASKIFGIRGTLYTSFPSFSLGLSELYFDYLFLDKFYIQAGKRSITWGNTELLEYNILSDSGSSTSVGIGFPFLKCNWNAIVFYNTNWGSGLTYENLSFAGSIEHVFGKLQVNLYGRKWATLDPNKSNPVLGLETKINIKGFDIYNQSNLFIDFDFDLNLDTPSNNTIDKYYCITGIMKDWDTPRIGFIFEYQYIYYNKEINPTKVDSHKIYFQGLISRLFNNTTKFALDYVHNFTTKTGTITPGYIYYALPHTELKVGLPFTYTDTTWKITPAVALSFEWNY